MSRPRVFARCLLVLLTAFSVTSCAPPWKKQKQKTYGRTFLGARLGMGPKELRRDVQAAQVNKWLLTLDKPSIEIKKVEFRMGPSGEYLGWIIVHYHPLRKFALKDFVRENFAILGKPSRSFFDKDKKTNADHEAWVWQDRKTAWEVRRITFPDNPELSDFVLKISDIAFMDVLQNTDTGDKRKFQRDMLRTGNF